MRRERIRDAKRTAALTAVGKGTCVGHPYPAADVRVIEIQEGAIASLGDARELPPGEIGEIIVRSPSVTREYFQRPEATRLSKIPVTGESSIHPAESEGVVYHRVGDVGYFDAEGRLWFCGRKAHLVETEWGRMFSVCCEAIFNEHPAIYRSALVGLGDAPRQTPVIVVEPEAGSFPESKPDRERLCAELLALGRANPLTERIERVLFHRSLPVDTRHNVKINREALREWAGRPD